MTHRCRPWDGRLLVANASCAASQAGTEPDGLFVAFVLAGHGLAGKSGRSLR